MTFDPEKLVRLADLLEKKSATADALAAEHEQMGEHRDALKHTRKAVCGREYAAVCREAAKRLKMRGKRASFTPPTWEEFNTYCAQKLAAWPESDRSKWYNHFQANGWMVGGKARMVDWKAAARNGFSNWKEKNPRVAQVVQKPGEGDPKGWREFLVSQNEKYAEYRYAIDYLQRDFEKYQQEQKQHSK